MQTGTICGATRYKHCFHYVGYDEPSLKEKKDAVVYERCCHCGLLREENHGPHYPVKRYHAYV